MSLDASRPELRSTALALGVVLTVAANPAQAGPTQLPVAPSRARWPAGSGKRRLRRP